MSRCPEFPPECESCDDLIVVTTAADAAADISELARDITCADEGHNNV